MKKKIRLTTHGAICEECENTNQHSFATLVRFRLHERPRKEPEYLGLMCLACGAKELFDEVQSTRPTAAIPRTRPRKS